tara:strand:+ start:136 stop:1665 length:1530 start_codon:yes stop_codon:yes gene_type:complete
MKKINVRSPFYITVQKEIAKIDPTDPCITDPSGNCLSVDPCIANPNLPQCPPQPVDEVFQDRNLICGSNAQSIGIVGAQVYNFEIDTSGRVNGDYTVSLNDLQVPVRIRMDVLANVPKTDLTTGTAFENVGLTAYSDTFTQAGYTTSGLSGTADADGNLDITKTFAYNSSSHTGNLRFQLHVPVVTNASMGISVTCPAKATVTTDPVTIGEVTIISFSSLNHVQNRSNNTSFRPSVKLNGQELGDGEAVFVKQNVIADELVFQAAQGTIMGVGRSRASEQFISTRRFIQAATNSGAAGTGLTTLPPLLINNGPPSYTNKEFMGRIPNGNVADFSVRTFSAGSRNTLVTYSGVNFIPDGTNTIEVLLPTNLDSDPVDPTNLEHLVFQISISKHTIKSFSNASPAGAYLTVPLSANPGLSGGPAEAMVFRGIMYGHSSKLTLDFEGNNNTPLNFDKKDFKHRFQIENPEVEDLLQFHNIPQYLTPFEQIQDTNPVTVSVNLANSPNITIPL